MSIFLNFAIDVIHKQRLLIFKFEIKHYNSKLSVTIELLRILKMCVFIIQMFNKIVQFQYFSAKKNVGNYRRKSM